MTPTQSRILESIKEYIHLNGISPTLQELADRHGVSKVTIHQHVEAMAHERVIKKTTKARSIVVMDKTPVKRARLCWKVIGSIATDGIQLENQNAEAV